MKQSEEHVEKADQETSDPLASSSSESPQNTTAQPNLFTDPSLEQSFEQHEEETHEAAVEGADIGMNLESSKEVTVSKGNTGQPGAEKHRRLILDDEDEIKEEKEKSKRSSVVQSLLKIFAVSEERKSLLSAHDSMNRKSSRKEETGSNKKLPGEDPNRIIELNLKDNPMLYQLLHYYLTREDPTITRQDVAHFGVSLLVALGSLILYFTPSVEYAGNNIIKRIIFVSCADVSNVGVAFLTASGTIRILFRDDLPNHLSKQIDEKATKHKIQRGLRYLAFSAAAAGGAAPFAFATGGPLYLPITVGATNWFMNFYGWEKAAYEDYRTVKQFISSLRSPQAQAFYLLRDAFNHAIRTVAYNQIETGKVPEELTFESRLDYSGFMKKMIDLAVEFKVQPQQTKTWTFYAFRRIIPGFLGGLFITLGMIGYFSKTYQLLSEKWSHNDELNIFLSALFLSSTIYLAAKLGGAKTFIFLADLFARQASKSVALQLYPLRTLITGAILLLFCAGSYATSANLVNNSPYFNEAQELKETENLKHAGALVQFKGAAAVLSIGGPAFFNNAANQQLNLEGNKTIPRYVAREDKKRLANFSNHIESYLETVNYRMSPTQCLVGIEHILKDETEERRRAILPVSVTHGSLDDLLECAKGDSVEHETKKASRLSTMKNKIGEFRASSNTFQQFSSYDEKMQREITDQLKNIEEGQISSFIRNYPQTKIGESSQIFLAPPTEKKEQDETQRLTSDTKKKLNCNIM